MVDEGRRHHLNLLVQYTHIKQVECKWQNPHTRYQKKIKLLTRVKIFLFKPFDRSVISLIIFNPEFTCGTKLLPYPSYEKVIEELKFANNFLAGKRRIKFLCTK